MGAEQSKAEEGFRQKQEQTIKNMAEKIKQLELRQQTTSPARPARVAAHQPASAPSPITYSVSVAPHLELERQQQTIKSMMDKIKELESRQQQTIQAQAPAHQPAPRVEHAREVKEVAQTTQPMKINMISINDLAKTSSASRATEQHRSAVVSQKLRKEMNVPVVPIYPQKTEQLTRDAVPSTSRNTLYPNLDNAKSSVSGLNKVQTKVYQPTFNPSTTTSWATNNDYVIIDNNKNTGRLEPTAPPLEQTTTPEKQFTSKTYRSVSKTRKNAQTQSDKDEHLNCRTCQNNLGLKIFQCSKGHSSCHDCKMRGNNCGACGYPITDVRNIAVETYIAETKTTCPNKNNGCCLSFKLADIKFHLKKCPYSDLNCPLDSFVEDCWWRGKLNNLGAHFQEEHPQYKNSVDTENTISDLRSNSWNLQFIQLGTFNFLVHFKISGDEDRVFMAVQLLGTGVSASKWRYEIHVYNKSNPRRKYQHTDVCTSHNSVLASELFAEGLCASIPMSYAKSYGNFKNRLTYKIYIMKDEDVYTRGRGRGGRRGRGRGRSGSNTPRGESSYGNVSPNVFEDD